MCRAAVPGILMQIGHGVGEKLALLPDLTLHDIGFNQTVNEQPARWRLHVQRRRLRGLAGGAGELLQHGACTL